VDIMRKKRQGTVVIHYARVMGSPRSQQMFSA
jgi:hypothetical protein